MYDKIVTPRLDSLAIRRHPLDKDISSKHWIQGLA